MQTIIGYLSSGFSNIAPFFILLGLLIFVHELGHFLVARWCGVRVETFSLGFGKRIFSWKPGETNYCMSIIPLGGFVKMYGDDPSAEIPPELRSRSFLHKKVWQRVAIVLAGPLMNLFFAIFLFMVISRVGEEMPSARVGDIAENTMAFKIGFRTGDKVLDVDGTAVQTWQEVQNKIEASADQPMHISVEHPNHVRAVVIARPTRVPNDNVLSSASEIGQIDGLSNESLASVVGVVPESPAAKAGVETLDLVVAVNDQAVSSFSELEQQVKAAFETGSVRLKVRNADADDKPENTRVADIKVPTEINSEYPPLKILGLEPSELYIWKVKPGSPAARAGVMAKDRILAIDGQPVTVWNEFLNRVKSFTSGGAPIKLTVMQGGAPKNLEILPEMTETMNTKFQEEKRFTIGVVSGSIRVVSDLVLVQAKNPADIVTRGLKQTVDWTGFMVMSMVRVVQGRVSAKNIGGVITIGRVASRSFEVGLSAFLKTMAIISINLFMINLLPVPVLDGGHLLFFSLEAMRGSPLSLRKLELAQQVGLTLLIMLMAFALFNDVSNFFTSRW